MTLSKPAIALSLISLSACAQIATALSPKPPAPEVPAAPPITSELHRANTGKVVFANTKIAHDAQSAALIDHASLADTVEVRAYFSTTPAQALLAASGHACDAGSYELVWDMRGAGDAEWRELHVYRLGMPLAETWMTTRMQPLWGPARAWPQIFSEDRAILSLLQAKQDAGQFALEVRVHATCRLKSDGGKDDRGKATALMSTGALAVAIDPAAVRDHVTRRFGTQPHQFAHADDFKVIEAEAKRTWSADDVKILWVRVPQREWTIVRGELGQIAFRGATVTTAIRKGGQCAIKTAIAREDAIGGGRFVAIPRMVAATNEFPETVEMPCSAL